MKTKPLKPETLIASLAYITTGSGITKLVSIATVVLVVNAFGNAEYGLYLLVIGATSLFGTIYALISGQIYQVEFARLAGQKLWRACDGLHAQAMRMSAVVAICTAMLVAALYGAIELLPSAPSWLADARGLIVLGALLSICGGLKEVLVGTNRGWKRFRQLAIWETVEAAFRLGLVVSVIMAGRFVLDVSALILIDCAALVLGAAFYGLLLRNRNPRENNDTDAEPAQIPTLIELIRSHGLWFALRLLIVELTANGRNWLIAGVFSFEALGVFGVAKRIAQSGKVLMPMGTLFNSYFPHQSGDADGLRATYAAGMRLSALISFGTMAILVAFALFGAPFFFSEDIQTLQILIIILSFIYPVKIITYGVSSMLNLDRRYKTTFLTVLVSAISMVVLTPPLMFWLGLYGVALETILSSIIGAIVSYYALLRHRPDFRVPLLSLIGLSGKSTKMGKK